jgi:ABC-type transport system involved in multi-copper enzyme maturation permease subunit
MAGNVLPQPKAGPRLGKLPRLIGGGWQSLRHNPIIIKELRHRMRSWHGLVDLATFSLLLSGFGLIMYNTYQNSNRIYSYRSYIYNVYTSNAQTPRSQELGSNYFVAIVVAQLFLACMLAPSFSAPTIAGEKERQTYDIMLVTLLRPRDIVAGKLFSALAYLMLVTIAGVPIASVAFLMGGLGPDQLIAGVVVILVTGLSLGAIGIYWSSAMSRSVTANRNAFINILLLYFVGPLLIVYGLNVGFQPTPINFQFSTYAENNLKDAMMWVSSINPMYAIVDTNEILKNRPGSNVLFFGNTPKEFLFTPVTRFLFISSGIIFIYLWQAVRHIRPLRPEAQRMAKTSKPAKTAPSAEAKTTEPLG